MAVYSLGKQQKKQKSGATIKLKTVSFKSPAIRKSSWKIKIPKVSLTK